MEDVNTDAPPAPALASAGEGAPQYLDAPPAPAGEGAPNIVQTRRPPPEDEAIAIRRERFASLRGCDRQSVGRSVRSSRSRQK